MRMEINFQKDLRTALLTDYSGLGFQLTDREEIGDLLLDYLTINKKLVRPQKRRVRYAPALLRKMFSHPKKSEILYLERLFKQGYNVNQFQSRRLFETGFHDHMLYEWDIFHFHLSLDKDPKSNFKKQTKQLLFVFISKTEAIFLGTDNHSEGVFGDIKWIQILHDHFPETISQYKDSTITEVRPLLTAVERQGVWNKGYSLGFISVNGATYMSPGIGRTTSGHSIHAVKQKVEIMRWLSYVQELVILSKEKIISALGVKDAIFKLQFGLHIIEIVEETSRNRILEYPGTEIKIDT